MRKTKSIPLESFIQFYPEFEKAYGSYNAKTLTEYAVSQHDRKRPKMFSIINSTKKNPPVNLPVAFSSNMPALNEKQKEEVEMHKGINISPMFRMFDDDDNDFDYVEEKKEQRRERPHQRFHNTTIMDEEYHNTPEVPEYNEDEYDEYAERYPEKRSHLNEVKREIVSILSPAGRELDRDRETRSRRGTGSSERHTSRKRNTISFDITDREHRNTGRRSRSSERRTARRRPTLSFNINPRRRRFYDLDDLDF